MVKRYDGTRLGRQELDGEIIEDRPDALWSRGGIESCRVAEARAACSGLSSRSIRRYRRARAPDACGLVAAGRGENDMLYVIADETVSGLSPAGWAAKAIALWRRLEADALVVEVNQGGDMVRSVIREADAQRAGDCGARAAAASGCAQSRSRRCTSRGRSSMPVCFLRWKTRCATSGWMAFRPAARPTGSTPMVWAVTHLTFGAQGWAARCGDCERSWRCGLSGQISKRHPPPSERGFRLRLTQRR